VLTFVPSAETFFRDQPIEQRIARFSSLGFVAYEIWWHWTKDLDALLRANAESGMHTATLTAPKVPLTDDARHEEYKAALETAVEAARRLGCTRIVTHVGNELPGKTRAEQRRNVVDGLKMSAEVLERAGMTLLVEPLNLVAHKGYFLSRSDETREILESVGSTRVRMLFDVYHQQISEGNIIHNIREHYDFIGHFHVADNPGRHELGTGELNYPNIFQAITDLGYDGFIGLELLPKDPDQVRALQTSTSWRPHPPA
jgi:hydroxypyruvate isomerase